MNANDKMIRREVPVNYQSRDLAVLETGSYIFWFWVKSLYERRIKQNPEANPRGTESSAVWKYFNSETVLFSSTLQRMLIEIKPQYYKVST